MIELFKYIQEGILSDIDDTLNGGDEYIKRYETFGFKYKLNNIFTIKSPKEVDYLDTHKLQKLTKDMYVNDFLKNHSKDSWMTSQLHYLCIFIDNINREELKIGNKNLCYLRTSDKQIKDFSNNIKNILTKEEILKSDKNYVYVYVTGARRLTIHIEVDNNDANWIELEYKFEE